MLRDLLKNEKVKELTKDQQATIYGGKVQCVEYRMYYDEDQETWVSDRDCCLDWMVGEARTAPLANRGTECQEKPL